MEHIFLVQRFCMGKMLVAVNFLGGLYWVLDQSCALTCITWAKPGLQNLWFPSSQVSETCNQIKIVAEKTLSNRSLRNK